MSLHRERNVVLRQYYSFQLRPLAAAWQSDRPESANFLKFRNHFFCVFGTPCSKACRIMQICCVLAFSVGLHCLDRRCIVSSLWCDKKQMLKQFMVLHS